MKRILSILSAASVTLVAIALALTVASFLRQIYVRLPFSGPHGALWADKGAMGIMWDAPAPASFQEQWWWMGWGCRYEHALVVAPASPQQWPVRIIRINLCLPLLAFSILPAIVYGRRFQQWRHTRARLHAGRCIKCGYDLRATPERCPECGMAAPKR